MMCLMVIRRLCMIAVAFVLLPTVAHAHSYADPALATVFVGLQPVELPAGVTVAVRPSVVDELVVSNTTTTPLEVLALGGEPFLRISAAGVEANLASPDWYSTGTPEGGAPVPGQVQRDGGKGQPRWVKVSSGSTWSEFDSRLRPPVEVSPQVRAAGKDRMLASWQIPLRYGSVRTAATGQIVFTPVRGGLVVAVTRSPVTVTVLQGKLPGLFLRAAPGEEVVVQGKDGVPFLRFSKGRVEANTVSASWREDQQARGLRVRAAGWVTVGEGGTYSWLDARLRYPRDLPPDDLLTKGGEVQRWAVPVTVGGATGSIEGAITWVPRSAALKALRPTASQGRSWLWWLAAVPMLVVAGSFLRRRHPFAPAERTGTGAP